MFGGKTVGFDIGDDHAVVAAAGNLDPAGAKVRPSRGTSVPLCSRVVGSARASRWSGNSPSVSVKVFSWPLRSAVSLHRRAGRQGADLPGEVARVLDRHGR